MIWWQQTGRAIAVADEKEVFDRSTTALKIGRIDEFFQGATIGEYACPIERNLIPVVKQTTSVNDDCRAHRIRQIDDGCPLLRERDHSRSADSVIQRYAHQFCVDVKCPLVANADRRGRTGIGKRIVGH